MSGALTHDIEVEDTLVAIVRFRNGSLGTIEVSTSCPPGFPRRVELSGAGGTVGLAEEQLCRWEFTAERPGDDELRQRAANCPPPPPPSPVPSSEGHARQIANLVAAIRDGAPLAIGGREASRAVEAICGLYESARTGKPYRFRP